MYTKYKIIHIKYKYFLIYMYYLDKYLHTFIHVKYNLFDNSNKYLNYSIQNNLKSIINKYLEINNNLKDKLEYINFQIVDILIHIIYIYL